MKQTTIVFLVLLGLVICLISCSVSTAVTGGLGLFHYAKKNGDNSKKDPNSSILSGSNVSAKPDNVKKYKGPVNVPTMTAQDLAKLFPDSVFDTNTTDLSVSPRAFVFAPEEEQLFFPSFVKKDSQFKGKILVYISNMPCAATQHASRMSSMQILKVYGKGQLHVGLIDEDGNGGVKGSSSASKVKQSLEKVKEAMPKVSNGNFSVDIVYDENPSSVKCPGVATTGVLKYPYECNACGAASQLAWKLAMISNNPGPKQNNNYRYKAQLAIVGPIAKCGFAGIAGVMAHRDGFGVIKTPTSGVIMHEYLHTLGAEHSGRGVDEYGDLYCVMGGTRTVSLNSVHMFQLGWLNGTMEPYYVNVSKLSSTPKKYTLALDGRCVILFREVIPFMELADKLVFSDTCVCTLYFISYRSECKSVQIHQRVARPYSGPYGFNRSQLLYTIGNGSSSNSSYTLDIMNQVKVIPEWHYMWGSDISKNPDDVKSLASVMNVPAEMQAGTLKPIVVTVVGQDSANKTYTIEIKTA